MGERSEHASCNSSTQCLVIDSMGELVRYYAACDLAFVGGTITEIGGHNVLEPAALGKPVLLGPHTANIQEISVQLIEQGGAVRVHDPQQLAETVGTLVGDHNEREKMSRAAMALVRSGRGALDKTVKEVEKLLGETE